MIEDDYSLIDEDLNRPMEDSDSDDMEVDKRQDSDEDAIDPDALLELNSVPEPLPIPEENQCYADQIQLDWIIEQNRQRALEKRRIHQEKKDKE